jgi:hypothetical protein
MQVVPAKIDTTDRLLSIAMLLVGGMVLATLLRYPSVREHLKVGLVGLALVCVAATLTFFLGSGPLFAAEGKKIGVHVGVLTGLMWVAEISFNNFVDPRISTGGNRFYVDNSFWAAIALVILITSFATASKCHKISAGVRVGLWSGYISGTISCLMALSLVLFGMASSSAIPSISKSTPHAPVERLPSEWPLTSPTKPWPEPSHTCSYWELSWAFFLACWEG